VDSHVSKDHVGCGIGFVRLRDGFHFPALSQNYQRTPIVLSASHVLPREWVSGPNYRIKEPVINDGLVSIYELETFYEISSPK